MIAECAAVRSVNLCSPTCAESSDYNEQLAELASDISVKQRLIDELERSQRRMETMRQHYEEKLLQLSDRIRATEQERDKVIANISEWQQWPDRQRGINPPL